MPMQTIIRQKRLELGLTQEQVAERLGVTAPAVNKWEKGTTCPDLALVAPLARLLKTDVNTLLCFREDLTDQEIGQLGRETVETVQREGFAAGFRLAADKLREYPACDKLTYSMAVTLEGALLLAGLSGEEKAGWQDRIDALYERVADSGDQRVRNGALYMLASKAIQRGDCRRAEALLDRLPEQTTPDKRQLKANLLLAQGKTAEAGELLELKCMNQANELQITLMSLMSLAQTEGDQEAAAAIGAVSAGVVDLLGLWAYGKCVAPMELALGRKDVSASVAALEDLLAAVLRPWDMERSPLHRHIGSKYRGKNQSFGEQALPGLLAELEHDPKFDFLREDQGFHRLVERYRARCSGVEGRPLL